MKRKIFKTINKAGTTKIVDNYIKLLIPTLSLMILVGLISYVSLTSITFLNASKYDDYNKKIAEKSANILNLETKLSSINKSITPALALNKGFKETHSIKYITNKPITKLTSANEI